MTVQTYAMPVGGCAPDEELDKCTAGANAYGVDNVERCRAGKKVGITVTCAGMCNSKPREMVIFVL